MKIEKELSKLISLFGDTLSEELVLEYYNSKNPDRVERYNQIKTSRETGAYCEDDIINKNVSEFMKIYESKTTMFDKFKLLCEFGLSKEEIEVVLCQIPNTDEVKSHYLTLGPQKLRSLSYNITKIRKTLGIVMFSPELLIQEVYSEFREGEKYTLSNLKNKLSLIYSSINYQSTPKANDIERYFEIKGIVAYEKDEKTGKRKQIRGYELVRSRERELRQELKLVE